MPDTIHAMFINLVHNQCYTCYNVQVKWLRCLIQECLYNMHYNTFASRPLLFRCPHVKAEAKIGGICDNFNAFMFLLKTQSYIWSTYWSFFNEQHIVIDIMKFYLSSRVYSLYMIIVRCHLNSRIQHVGISEQ